MTLFHRIEEYSTIGLEAEEMVISFDTEYRRIWQCKWTRDGGMREIPNEPPFESLTGEEQKIIKEIGPFIFYTTFGKLPQELSEQST